MTINVVVELGPNLQRLLQGVSAKLDTIISNQIKEQVAMSKLDDEVGTLAADVTKQTSVEQSAITLLNSIGGLIAKAVQDAIAAGATPGQIASIRAVHDTVTTNTTELAAAVAANIQVPPGPPQPQPTPTPGPTP